jgi:hypothetical protein
MTLAIIKEPKIDNEWNSRYIDEYVGHLDSGGIYDYFVKHFFDDEDVPMYMVDGVAYRDTENYQWCTDYDMAARRYIVSWRRNTKSLKQKE